MGYRATGRQADGPLADDDDVAALHHLRPRGGGQDADVGGGEGVRDVAMEAGDAGDLHARPELELERAGQVDVEAAAAGPSEAGDCGFSRKPLAASTTTLAAMNKRRPMVTSR